MGLFDLHSPILTHSESGNEEACVDEVRQRSEGRLTGLRANKTTGFISLDTQCLLNQLELSDGKAEGVAGD